MGVQVTVCRMHNFGVWACAHAGDGAAGPNTSHTHTQVTVLQGSVDVLQRSLASCRADLAAAREQQLADALAAQVGCAAL